MYLVDTDVISEARKGLRAHPGVRGFFADAGRRGDAIYLSAVTMSELRHDVERVRYRGDAVQARHLDHWLGEVAMRYAESILPVDADVAEVRGRLRVPNADNPLDKQIAATALVYGLVVVTRNVAHFAPTGVPVRDPCA
ncbi:MAG: type II toxin-antitoxin system VapC family toxin [Sinobacteraceae bacterium]|nr:type II toxin-antitoxin system VapC family toxin [Nevskiaceae bacterium]MCP5470697.1 type II toxin-antitoxin system VapC family toxin [Nevskiaceae bacterium]